MEILKLQGLRVYMPSPKYLCAYYREHFATRGFRLLSMGKTFAVYCFLGLVTSTRLSTFTITTWINECIFLTTWMNYWVLTRIWSYDPHYCSVQRTKEGRDLQKCITLCECVLPQGQLSLTRHFIYINICSLTSHFKN